MEISEFALSHVFNHLPATDDRDEAWWAHCAERGAGYVLIWADGESFHSYRCPADWY